MASGYHFTVKTQTYVYPFDRFHQKRLEGDF